MWIEVGMFEKEFEVVSELVVCCYFYLLKDGVKIMFWLWCIVNIIKDVGFYVFDDCDFCSGNVLGSGCMLEIESWVYKIFLYFSVEIKLWELLFNLGWEDLILGV